MTNAIRGLFTSTDRVQMESLNQRLRRNQVINSNIANAETPGYRALGYDFEEQLQEVLKANEGAGLKTSNPLHLKHEFAQANGEIRPDVFVRPSESVGQDGNTVDIDKEMADLAQNEILYRSAVETINRKVGMLRYAISGGR